MAGPTMLHSNVRAKTWSRAAAATSGCRGAVKQAGSEITGKFRRHSAPPATGVTRGIPARTSKTAHATATTDCPKDAHPLYVPGDAQVRPITRRRKPGIPGGFRFCSRR